jgi:hypothetical protein
MIPIYYFISSLLKAATFPNNRAKKERSARLEAIMG